MSDTLTLGEGTVRLHRADGIATITLDRPDVLNAIDHRMWGGLLEAFRTVTDEPRDRCVVLRGEGRAFCAGADLADAASGEGAAGVGRSTIDHMRKIAEVCLAVHECPKPVVARVHGIAAGAGCNLALGADLVVAGSGARFCEIFVRRGLSIDFGGSWLLPRLVGLHKAKELTLLGEMVDAAEAHRIGLVSRLVDTTDGLDALDAEVADVAGRLAAGPPIAMAASKRLLNAGLTSSMTQALEAESNIQCVNFGTEDAVEAVSAFLEKREASFRGR
jgi:2-(1,2-epoxy-1,2-dihydrophenyl)acetyl-CoA isomerase